MTTFRNVSPLGALDVPDLGRVIAAGEVFEVPADLAPMFAAQSTNYEPADEDAETLSAEAAAAQQAAEQEGEAALSGIDPEPVEPEDVADVSADTDQPAPTAKRKSAPAPAATDQEVTA